MANILYKLTTQDNEWSLLKYKWSGKVIDTYFGLDAECTVMELIISKSIDQYDLSGMPIEFCVGGTTWTTSDYEGCVTNREFISKDYELKTGEKLDENVFQN